MSVKEEITQAVQNLDDAELQQIADYLAFLRFRARKSRLPSPDAVSLDALYAESAENDLDLAEQGMAEYTQGLLAEDEK